MSIVTGIVIMVSVMCLCFAAVVISAIKSDLSDKGGKGGKF